jgi:hypothetical protein
LSAIARSSSLSKPVNWPAELMQMLGGASESVPTVSVPGTLRPSALTLTAVNGPTVAVVYLSASGPVAALARLVGSALALWTPGGAHWSTLAAAGGAGDRTTACAANPMLPISQAIRTTIDVLTAVIQAR